MHNDTDSPFTMTDVRACARVYVNSIEKKKLFIRSVKSVRDNRFQF